MHSPHHHEHDARAHGITLVELLVTLAIFGAVTTVILGSFLTLFSVREQTSVAQQANDDIRVILDGIDREIQAGNNISVGGSTLSFVVSSRGDASPYPVEYKLLSNAVQKAVGNNDVPGDPCNYNPNTMTFINVDACFLPITGKNVKVAALDFSVETPEKKQGQTSPLVTLSFVGEVSDSSGKKTPLSYSTSITPRNRVTVSDVASAPSSPTPTITLVHIKGQLPNNCLVSENLYVPIDVPETPPDGFAKTYYTNCSQMNIGFDVNPGSAGLHSLRYIAPLSSAIKYGTGETGISTIYFDQDSGERRRVTVNPGMNEVYVIAENLYGDRFTGIFTIEKIGTAQCSNWVDDDGDGFTDYAGGDPDCTDAFDDSESGSALPPVAVNGSCGATNNSCIAGSYVDVADTATDFRWDCEGQNGGSDAVCSVAKPLVAVNGSCGATNNSCIAGSYVDVADTATDFRWDCEGQNGGSDAVCSVAKPLVAVNGSCGATNNSCIAGSYVDVADTATDFRWDCEGQNGGSDAVCSVAKPLVAVNGSCGATNNSCIAGSYVDVADTATDFKWDCEGQNGGSDAVCSVAKPLPNPPNGLNAVASGSCNDPWVSLTWDPVPGATQYQVQTPTGPQFVGSNAFIDTVGLANNTMYTYWVKVFVAGVWSDWSTPDSVTTLATCPACTPVWHYDSSGIMPQICSDTGDSIRANTGGQPDYCDAGYTPTGAGYYCNALGFNVHECVPTACVPPATIVCYNVTECGKNIGTPAVPDCDNNPGVPINGFFTNESNASQACFDAGYILGWRGDGACNKFPYSQSDAVWSYDPRSVQCP